MQQPWKKKFTHAAWPLMRALIKKRPPVLLSQRCCCALAGIWLLSRRRSTFERHAPAGVDLLLRHCLFLHVQTPARARFVGERRLLECARCYAKKILICHANRAAQRAMLFACAAPRKPQVNQPPLLLKTARYESYMQKDSTRRARSIRTPARAPRQHTVAKNGAPRQQIRQHADIYMRKVVAIRDGCQHARAKAAARREHVTPSASERDIYIRHASARLCRAALYETRRCHCRPKKHTYQPTSHSAFVLLIQRYWLVTNAARVISASAMRQVCACTRESNAERGRGAKERWRAKVEQCSNFMRSAVRFIYAARRE